jgi:hypothetical protein
MARQSSCTESQCAWPHTRKNEQSGGRAAASAQQAYSEAKRQKNNEAKTVSATNLSSELLTVNCKDGDPTAARRWQAISAFTYPAIRVSLKGTLNGTFRTAASADFQMTDIQASAQFVERIPDPTGNASEFYKVSRVTGRCC